MRGEGCDDEVDHSAYGARILLAEVNRLKRIEEAAMVVVEVEGEATPHHRALAKALTDAAVERRRPTHPTGGK